MPTIGLYPGTFDSIHSGHIAFAKTAQSQFNLDAVYFLPEETPRYKQHVTPVDKRIRAISEALSSSTALSVLKLDSTTFTISGTLPEIERRFPGHRFALLVGSDVALGIVQWENLERMLPSYHLIVGLRGETAEPEIHEALGAMNAGIRKSLKISFIKTVHAHVSSSSIKH